MNLNNQVHTLLLLSRVDINLSQGSITHDNISISPFFVTHLFIHSIYRIYGTAESEWTCDKCTLINAGMFEQCFACDAPRS